MNETLNRLKEIEVPDLGFRTFIVGGCVRDALLGVESKDIDMAVEAPSFEAMRDAIVASGATVFVETPEFLTIRAKSPVKGAPTLDFVMCRKDGPSADGRRPDFVEAGSIVDDLARRDFKMNAVALDVKSGELIDPFGGMIDIEAGVIDFVGDASDRIREDGLRVLRAFRFAVTKGFAFTPSTKRALFSPLAVEMLGCVSVERIREELNKMFKADTLATLNLFNEFGPDMFEVMFRDGLRLDATLKG